MECLLPAGTPGELDDDALLALYDGAAPGPGETRVTFNFVTSLDGAATVAGRSGALGNAADQRVFALLRRRADVILVGAGTVRAEGYGGPLLDEAAQAWRRDRGQSGHPPLAIVSGGLHLDPTHPVFTQAPVRPLLLTLANTLDRAPTGHRAALAAVADLVTVGERRLDVPRLLRELADRGLRRVHAEGGPTLFAAFEAAAHVDELCLTLSPLLAGGTGPRILTPEPAGSAVSDSTRPTPLQLAHVLRSESMLFLRYTRPGS